MRIYYGEGNIWFSENNVVAFDMKVRGKYLLESYNPDSFVISEHKGRMIGFGFGGSVGTEPFLKYQGDLVIVSCSFVLGNDPQTLSGAVPLREYIDRFGIIDSTFDGLSENFENLDKGGAYGEYTEKTKAQWISKNLHTSGGEFLLNGEDYIGEYHFHQDLTAMTGSDHEDGAEILERKTTKLSRRKLLQTVRAYSSGQRTSGSGTSGTGGGY